MSSSQETPPTSEPQPETQPELDQTPREMVVRKAPKVAPFLVLGAVIGALIGLIILTVVGVPENYSTASATGFFIMIFGAPGLAVGGIVWLIVDRRSKKHTRTVYARRVDDVAEADVVIKNDDWQEYTQWQEAKANEPTKAELKAQYKAEKKAKKEAHKRRRQQFKAGKRWPDAEEQAANKQDPQDQPVKDEPADDDQ